MSEIGLAGLAGQAKQNEDYESDLNEAIIRRGLWIVAMIVAAGIGIAGFSIASGLFVA